ncbi:hypothetical protein Dsin_030412 [Dipteronia sinensis]|uniref:TITAN-like protein n=1 Tax=Dipteronia sinensis TaxID=43782 RepID=A0AAD9ZIW3_9ROSI|nr:hypothetical protein Dsin_030412 [Dipteronia sinensis]
MTMEADSRAKKPNPKPKPKPKPGPNSTNTKKKSEFEYCKVCNRNHNEGQRHKYFPSHTKSLSNFLSRFQNKITDIRFFLKNPSVLRPEHASRNRFWCVFCDFDVDELGSSFVCNNAINHLASVDHFKKLKHFIWKYGGAMDRVDAFRISEADVAKWEKNCKSLKSEATSVGEGSQELPLGPPNDIHNELNFENMNNFEKNTIHHLNSNISNGVMPLQYHTNECQISGSGFLGVANSGTNLHVVTSSLPADTCSTMSLWNSNYAMVNQNSPWNGTNCLGNVYLSGGMYQVYQDERVESRDINSQGLQNIAQVSSTVPKEAGGNVNSGAPPPWLGSIAQKEGGGNVHSGAPPPWLEATGGDKLELIPVLNSFISSNKSGKSKLNPKRVGAAWAEKRKMEMEMEKRGEIVKRDCDPNWLPNFGRVWQSGSRKESRKEFEIEKQKQPNIQCQSEMPVTVQPYISKRMRRDTTAYSGDPYVNK